MPVLVTERDMARGSQAIPSLYTFVLVCQFVTKDLSCLQVYNIRTSLPLKGDIFTVLPVTSIASFASSLLLLLFFSEWILILEVCKSRLREFFGNIALSLMPSSISLLTLCWLKMTEYLAYWNRCFFPWAVHEGAQNIRFIPSTVYLSFVHCNLFTFNLRLSFAAMSVLCVLVSVFCDGLNLSFLLGALLLQVINLVPTLASLLFSLSISNLFFDHHVHVNPSNLCTPLVMLFNANYYLPSDGGGVGNAPFTVFIAVCMCAFDF